MAHHADSAKRATVSVKAAHLGTTGPATNLDANHAKKCRSRFPHYHLDRREPEILQISQLNCPHQLFSVKPDLSLIPIVNIRQIGGSSIRLYPSLQPDVAQDIHPEDLWAHSDVNRLALVPESKGEGNSGALSLEPFEMSGLNFQVSVKHVGTGSAGERKKD